MWVKRMQRVKIQLKRMRRQMVRGWPIPCWKTPGDRAILHKVQWKKCNIGWRSGKKIDIVHAHSVIKGSDHNGINVKVIITSREVYHAFRRVRLAMQRK